MQRTFLTWGLSAALILAGSGYQPATGQMSFQIDSPPATQPDQPLSMGSQIMRGMTGTITFTGRSTTDVEEMRELFDLTEKQEQQLAALYKAFNTARNESWQHPANAANIHLDFMELEQLTALMKLSVRAVLTADQWSRWTGKGVEWELLPYLQWAEMTPEQLTQLGELCVKEAATFVKMQADAEEQIAKLDKPNQDTLSKLRRELSQKLWQAKGDLATKVFEKIFTAEQQKKGKDLIAAHQKDGNNGTLGGMIHIN
jgi:hypothetical protein